MPFNATLSSEKLAQAAGLAAAIRWLDRDATRSETEGREILRRPRRVRQFEKRLAKKCLTLLPNAMAPARAFPHAVFADGSAA